MNNILTLNQAIKWREELYFQNKTLAITNGCFDLLHAGHVSYLNEASSLADKMLILINSDESIKKLKGNNRPIINENDRAYILSNLKCVNKVVIFNNIDCSQELKLLSPDIYFKAGDYSLNTLNKKEYDALSKETKIIFIPITKNISTTKIIQKIIK